MTRLSHPEPQTAFHQHPPAQECGLGTARQRVIDTAAAVRRQRDWPRRPLAQVPLPAAPVLAEPVQSDRPWPPFRRAMRDGYALRAADLGAPLRCVGEVRAGSGEAPRAGSGECVAIMTGAAVPAELDTVVMIEHTQIDSDGRIVVNAGEHKGDNIAKVGSDSPAGAVVAAAGRRVTPAMIAAAASAGVTELVVFPPPRVAIIASGDELVAATAQPGAAQIRNSNGPMLQAQCRRYGAEVVYERLVRDEAAALEAALQEALTLGADVIVFAGGASVGSADLVAPLLDSIGVRLAFDAVRVRPGRPVLFGELGGRLYFGLPGNPLGAMLSCALLVRPAFELLAGLDADAITPVTVSAAMGFDYAGKPLQLDSFRPVRLRANRLRVETVDVRYHGSADLAAAAAADAFVHISPGVTVLPSGATVGVVLL